jgi:predicted permease
MTIVIKSILSVFACVGMGLVTLEMLFLPMEHRRGASGEFYGAMMFLATFCLLKRIDKGDGSNTMKYTVLKMFFAMILTITLLILGGSELMRPPEHGSTKAIIAAFVCSTIIAGDFILNWLGNRNRETFGRHKHIDKM